MQELVSVHRFLDGLCSDSNNDSASAVPLLRLIRRVDISCAPQKVYQALIARFRLAMVGCFWPFFFFADHRGRRGCVVFAIVDIVSAVQNVSTKLDQAQLPAIVGRLLTRMQPEPEP